MTDRVKGFYVALDHDIREDDCQPLINAIRLLQGVAAVTTLVAEPRDWIIHQRIRQEITKRLWRALAEGDDGG